MTRDTTPVELGPGETLVPLSEAYRLVGAPSPEALRARCQRAAKAGKAGSLGFQQVGRRWYVLIKDPNVKEQE
ncbi:hypothetical protein EDD41_2738 [Luteococcus japonicus]|uniref:Uncharacterized protein n=1 Tax=Luteococcus japonicus TaxID=33984 RepID=A0A3N1ZX91_9ACTN|nr:hypothetical protein EDD41_2738 [Luteococcus japonicus]